MTLLSDKQRTSLSKLLALVLRHQAHQFGLTLDPEGFVPLDELLAALNRERGWEWLRAEHIEDVIANQEKRRYEIVAGDIRAIYGHSLEAAVNYPQITPPDVLLHGRRAALLTRSAVRACARCAVSMST